MFSSKQLLISITRTIEAVAESLLTWAHANSEGSINLPSKPHAVIVLNKCVAAENDAAFWPSATSTEDLLSYNITRSEIFQKFCKNGIVDLRSLLRQFYSEVTVIRMPDKTNLKILDQQRRALYKLIYDRCESAHDVKAQTHMLANSDDLQVYLQTAFDHFSESLDEPFDFIAASVKNSPIPRDLADHIILLARLVSQRLERTQTDRRLVSTELVFDRLTQFVASCLRLDAARNNRLGMSRSSYMNKAKHMQVVLACGLITDTTAFLMCLASNHS